MDLSRIARGGTPITLDRPRLLFFDMAATWLLIHKYGDRYLQELYGVGPQVPNAAGPSLVLNSMEALQFYLWVGLQADCKLRGEELTLRQAGEFIAPFTFPLIFNAVIGALGRAMHNPPRAGEDAEGKADAAAAGAAVVADPDPAPKTKRSTSPKKKGSRSAPSAGRPKGSGRALSPSTTLRGRASSTG